MLDRGVRDARRNAAPASRSIHAVQRPARSPDAIRQLSTTVGNRALARILDHERGCACAACQARPAPSRRLSRCIYCGDLTCNYGEKCGRGGLLPPNLRDRHVGPYKESKEFSSKGKSEAEHPVPQQTLRALGLDPASAPAFQLEYPVHQTSRYGVGKGVTSTGGSSVANEWRAKLTKLLKSGTKADNLEAFKHIAVDELNAAEMHGQLTPDLVGALLGAMDECESQGLLDPGNAPEVKNLILDTYFRWKDDPQLLRAQLARTGGQAPTSSLPSAPVFLIALLATAILVWVLSQTLG